MDFSDQSLYSIFKISVYLSKNPAYMKMALVFYSLEKFAKTIKTSHF